MFGSFVISDSVGWVCGRNNTVVQTKDAGFTWESYNCGLKVEDDMDDIYFIDDTTGFVVGLGIYKYQLPKKHKAKIKVIDSTLCDNTPLILEAEGDYEYYDWNGFPGFKQKEVKQSGTYILSVYNMECDTIISDTITLNLKTPAKLNISDLSEAKCVGDSILLNPDLSNVVSYSWSDNFAEVSRKIFTDTDLTLVVEDTSGCLQEFNFSYKFIPLPKVNFKDYKSNTCRNEHVILEAEIENATTYHWYNRNKRLISNSPTLEVQNGEEYYIVAENSLGCSSVSDTIAISYEYIENQVSIMPLEGSNNIDLGEMEVLSPLSFTIEVNNTSDQEFVLEEAFMEANTCFSIPKSQFPLVIVANSTAELAVNFYCADYGELKDKLILRDRCDYDSIEVAIERLFYSFEANTKCEVPLKVTNVKMKYPRITHSHLSQNKGKITTYLEYIAEKDEPVLLTVYNTLGRKLFEVEPDNIIINKSGDFSFCEISTEIDMTQYSDGLYFLHIRIGGEYVVLNLTNFK
jgi:hypothetical protein